MKNGPQGVQVRIRRPAAGHPDEMFKPVTREAAVEKKKRTDNLSDKIDPAC